MLNKFFSVVIFVQDLFIHVCEIRYFTFNEEHMQRVLGNGVWRNIFASERKDVMGGWRKLHYVQFHDLFTLPNTGWSKCHLTLHV